MGLIPDPLDLVLSGDGSSLRTGSSPYGVKVCNCRKKGIFNCDCKRRFSDPEASWGWDSYRNEYYYGYSPYVLTAAASVCELPMYIRIVRACRHDSVSGIISLAEFKELYGYQKVSKFIADSAHDAYPFYELCEFLGIEPFIGLNCRVRSRKNWYFFIHFAAMNCHLDAWVKAALDDDFDIWAEVLGKALAA